MAKGGKYAAILPKLPKFPDVAPDRRDVIEATKTAILEPPKTDDPIENFQVVLDIIARDFKLLCDVEMRTTAGRRSAGEFARAYAELRKIADSLDSWKSDINLLLDAYTALMLEQFEIEGVSSLRLSNGQPVSTYAEPYAQVIDKEKFRLWCIAQGLERQMALHPSTTQKLTKDMLLAGDPEPDGVTTFAKTRIRLGAE